MEVFKNSVGRPSNETLKKRRNIKILCAVLIIAVLAAGVFLITKTFNKNDISGNGKNAAAVTIKFSSYSTTKTNLSLGTKVTFKHTVSGIGKTTYYERWTVFQDNSEIATGSSNKCKAIKANSGSSYIESDSLASPSSNGHNKFMRVIIYSDSKCTKQVAKADSTKYSWGTGSTGGGSSSGTLTDAQLLSKVTLSISNPTEFTETKAGIKIYKYAAKTNVSVTLKNGSNQTIYYRWYTKQSSNGLNWTRGAGYEDTMNHPLAAGKSVTVSFSQPVNTGAQMYRLGQFEIYRTSGTNSNIGTREFGSKYDANAKKVTGTLTLACYKANGSSINGKTVKSTDRVYCVPTSGSQTSLTNYTYTVKDSVGEKITNRVNSTNSTAAGTQKITEYEGSKSTPTKQWIYVYGKAGATVTVSVTQKNGTAKETKTATASFKIAADDLKPVISKACVKKSNNKPYVYIEVADQYKVKNVSWAIGDNCKTLTETSKLSLNVKSYKGFISNKVIDNSKLLYACAWDTNGNLTSKKVASSC